MSDDFWFWFIIILWSAAFFLFGFCVGKSPYASTAKDFVKIASNSADIKKECDIKYDMTVFKEVPIKCLKEYKVLQ